jgi:NAD(P)H-dependent FMN reductase
MITIVSATDRKGSNTRKVSNAYSLILEELNIPHTLLSLEDFTVFERNEAFQAMEKQYLIPAQKFIFVSPEYNGSFSGILKLMIDRSDIAACWHNKKALLAGVSTGRAGNLRGMEHLTGVLLYLKMMVHHNRLPISTVDKLLSTEGILEDPATLNVMKQQVEQFLAF